MDKHKVTNHHNTQTPLVLTRTKEAYRIWHAHLSNINRVDRYTIGIKIDSEFIEFLEIIFRAIFAYDKFEKLSLVSQAIGKNDLLKFFIQIGWERCTINNELYGQIIILLDEIGRMLGGWKRSLQEKIPST